MDMYYGIWIRIVLGGRWGRADIIDPLKVRTGNAVHLHKILPFALQSRTLPTVGR